MDPLIFYSFLALLKSLSPQMNSLIHSPSSIGGEETLAGLSLTKICLFSEYQPGLGCTRSCAVSKTDVLAMSSMCTVHSMDLSPHVGPFEFAEFSDHVWMTPSASPNLIFQNILVPEMMEFHSELSLVIRLYLLPVHLGFTIRRNVTCNCCKLFFPHQV